MEEKKTIFTLMYIFFSVAENYDPMKNMGLQEDKNSN